MTDLQAAFRKFREELVAREGGRAAVIAVRQSVEATEAFLATLGGGSEEPPTQVKANFYVAPQGNDGNDGSEGRPFRTFVRATRDLQPGQVLGALPGIYGEVLTCSRSGTAAAPIRIVSTQKHKAVIRPSGAGALCATEGNYVIVDGFELDGSLSPNGRVGGLCRGEGSAILNCLVHHIAQGGPITDANGGAGLIADGGYFRKGNQRIEGNIVHTIAVAGSARFHGIYHQCTGTIKRNVVYNVRGLGITLWHSPHHIDIENNTVAWAAGGIAVGAGDHYSGDFADFVNVRRNIVADCPFGISESGDTGPNNTYTDNTAFRCGSAVTVRTGRSPTGTLTSDPLFVNPGENDYRLQPGSPSAGRGAYP